jgi:ABC-type sugar transport system ATPase subunit
MTGVSLEHITKRFGTMTAVKDLSLRIASGEFMVLVGPSGCGKTTTLRMVAGLESVTAGTIRIGDKAVENLPSRARDIAMVFQDYALYPQMNVHRNLAFGLKVRKVPKASIAARVGHTAALLGLEEVLGRKPRELSGGQRQRVALGRALVREPRVFLMDEPLSNLDAKLRARTRGEIRLLQQQVGVTTLYVTHDQVEAMTMGDRIAVMSDGEIVQAGTPAEVYENPRNMFVAGFIGSPGMAFGRFDAREQGPNIELVNGELRLELEATARLPKEVVVGVRPEGAGLWTDDAGMIGPLHGRVAYVEALGRETLIGVDLGGELEPVVQVGGRCSLDPGDRISIGLRRGGLYLFDGGTQITLVCL